MTEKSISSPKKAASTDSRPLSRSWLSAFRLRISSSPAASISAKMPAPAPPAAIQAARCNRTRHTPTIPCHSHPGNSNGHEHLESSQDQRILPSMAALLPTARCNNKPRPTGPYRRRTAGHPAYSSDTRRPRLNRAPTCRTRSPLPAPALFPASRDHALNIA